MNKTKTKSLSKRGGLNKNHKKKVLLLSLLIPIGLLAVAATTVGGLYVAGVIAPKATPTNIASIFTDGTSVYQWSNSATTNAQTNIEDSSKDGSAAKPWNLADSPSTEAIIDNLNSFLTRSNQQSKNTVFNDLTFTAWAQEASTNFYKCTASSNTASYDGSFQIGLYWNQTHDLSGAVTSRIVDYSSIATTKTAGDVLASLSTQNSSFHPEAVEIGYTSQSTFYSYTPLTQMTQTNLANLWKDIGNSNGYGYELTLQAKTGGWYSGSTNINIYVKLKRTSFNVNLFGNDRSLNNNGGANPFITIPNLEQATRAWITRYNSTAFDGGIAAWANFYTSNTSNCNLEIDTGKLKLQYGDANQFYTSDSGTATFFTFNVQQKESLADVFKNNDHTTSIPTDTATNNLIYINGPSATHECWVDTITLLKEQYSSGTYSDFRGADFTSMYIYSVSSSNGTTGFNGTLTVSPLTGSLFYEGTVTLYWKTYNYTA